MFDSKKALEETLKKVDKTASRIKGGVPYRTHNGVYDDKEDEINWWTNGFYGGILWLAYRKTGEKKYVEWANELENKLQRAIDEFYNLDHDVGFLFKLTSAANYKFTKNQEAARRAYKAASILASRFNPKGSFIRAWNGADNNGWSIIDCVMNLSILYWASNYKKDPHFSNIAQAYDETAMEHFIRKDGSVKHICVFDAATGEYIKNLGGQGYGVDSSWSRGTAWALYGFAIATKYAGRKDFLDTSKHVANFFISHLPEDFVPFSDFIAPKETNIHKDSSAAACAASGLLLLSELVGENESAVYRTAAEKIVESLYKNYTDWEHDEALLEKGCVAYNSNEDESETSLIYGDYFFLEALMRLNGEEGLF